MNGNDEKIKNTIVNEAGLGSESNSDVQKQILGALDFGLSLDDIVKKISYQEIITYSFFDPRIKQFMIDNLNNILKGAPLNEPLVRHDLERMYDDLFSKIDDISWAPAIAFLCTIKKDELFLKKFLTATWYGPGFRRRNPQDFFTTVNAGLSSENCKDEYIKRIAVKAGWLVEGRGESDTPNIGYNFMDFKDEYFKYSDLCDQLGIKEKMYYDGTAQVNVNPLSLEDVKLYQKTQKFIKSGMVDSVKYIPSEGFNLFDVSITELTKDQKDMIVQIYGKEFLSDLLFNKYFG